MSDFKQEAWISHPTPLTPPSYEVGGIAKRIKIRSPSAKNPIGTWYFTSAHNFNTILIINYLSRTRSIACLPGKIVLRNLTQPPTKKSYYHQFFSLWNGERFLSLVQCGMASWEGGGGIVWLAAWKLVSNDAKRTVAPPNVKHSTLLQGCFLCFCFWFHSQFDNIA